MLEKIDWKQDYKIGIEEIDFQHQYFTLLINKLIDDLVESKDEYYNCRLLEELSQYASFHFISEENRMIRCNYPFIEDHKDLHRNLISQLNDQINYFKMAKSTIEDIISFLTEWFLHHTVEKDCEFGEYFKETNKNVK
ncbi:bacteriohemerythrin [Desulfobacula phenolica]|uniref:Hemerythrin n=1 Tax=Desulfobacula phenolica TaxID=90732 RepID=A0A1H2JGU9_9BACT|nr:bacteriohemerythrin [Desulfobacula phenolica]SDU55622.1 hemerythrin [Desulfobacula phenolica]